MAWTNDIDEFYELECTEAWNKNILIEGDSWVSHPFLNNLTNQFDYIGRENYNILNLASPGDTVNNIMNPKGSQIKKLIYLLDTPKWACKFDLIFLSAAGNDIVGSEILTYVKNKTSNHNKYGKELIKNSYYETIHEIVKDYKTFLKLKNQSSLNSDTPVVTHAYSYLYPRKVGTHLFGHMFNKGWVCIYLEQKGIEEKKEQIEIVNHMIDYFYEQMMTIEDEKFLIVDTREVLLKNDKPNKAEFFDEIHPRGKGFKKIAKVIYKEAKEKGLWPV